MADYLDSFVDTREKRRLLIRLLCWLCWLAICGVALYTAYRLIRVSDYAGLFGLLDAPDMEWFVISRMVLQAMSIAQGSWWDYLSAALSVVSLPEWILLFVSLFLACGSRRIWKHMALVFVQFLYFLAVGILFLLALRASSLQEVIGVLRMIGMLSFGVYGVVALVLLIQLAGTLCRYRRALLVHPVEISVEEGAEGQE